VKPLPVTPAFEIVRLVPPVFDRVSALVWLLPMAMLPKLRLEGALRQPGPPVPVPDKRPVALAKCPLRLPQAVAYTTVRLPLTAPAVPGSKATDKFALVPGDKLIGRLGPTNL
jgi:hypothetical protein